MAPTTAMKKVYDYLVIGAGSGGLASARRAASYGAKVGIIEAARYGGTCVNVGCVPKKVMWNTATMAEVLHHDAKGYGFQLTLHGHSWPELKAKRDAYIKRLNGIYEANLTKDGVDQIAGWASFVDDSTVSVGGDLYTAKHILIAVGSKAFFPPDVPGAAEYGLLSDGFFELNHLPKRVALVGAGYIAVELAGIFLSLGAEVTLFIRSDHLLRAFDPVIGDTVMEEYRKAGMTIVTQSDIRRVERTADGTDGRPKSHTIHLRHKDTDALQEMGGFEEVIWAVGRGPNTEPLKLANTSITCNKQGWIEVDEWQQTKAAPILALGDVCGVELLTPVAIAAGRRLSDRLFGGKPDSKLDYSLVPSVIFSHPAAGSIGLSEADAVTKYGKDQVKVYSSKFTNMYFSMSDRKQTTIHKLVCAGPEERVVGLHIVGLSSDEILQGFAVAIKMGATKRDFDNTMAIHPTAGEELVTMR